MIGLQRLSIDPSRLLPRLVQWQLVAFVVVTVLALSLMAANYVRIPEMLGVGRYEVSAQLPEAGGLYPKAVVTYRGREVGVVEALRLHGAQGVDVRMSIDDGIKIPRGSKVQVRSASVVGEQYLNFEPDGSASSQDFLADGDTVPMSLASLPVSTSQLLGDVTTFLDSVPVADLRTTVRELGRSVEDDGDALGRLIDNASSLQQQATENLDETRALLRAAGPVLATQEETADDFRSWTSNMASLTDQLASNDDTLRRLLTSAAPVGKQAAHVFDGLAPVLPGLLGDLSDTAHVLQVYVPSLRHVLIIFPAAVEALLAAVPKYRRTLPITEVNLSFKMNLGAPPVCTDGYPLAGKFRSPQDTSYAPPPPDSFCDVAADDPRIPRGARNQKCPNNDGYGQTAATCGLFFQRRSTAASSYSKLGVSSAAYNGRTGQMIAPDGNFYLLDSVARSTPYDDLGDLMTRLTR